MTLRRRVGFFVWRSALVILFASRILDLIWGIESRLLEDILIGYLAFWGLVSLLRSWRMKNFAFSSIGLEASEVLRFEKDPAVTCVIAAENGEKVTKQGVLFGGEEMSLCAAARKALHAVGYDLERVRGAQCWEFEGRSLQELVLDMDTERSFFP